MTSWQAGRMAASVAVPWALVNTPFCTLPLPSVPLAETGLPGFAIEIPPDRKVTVPVGRKPAPPVLMVAVNVTGLPCGTLLLLGTTTVAVGAWVTVIETAAELLPLKPASPL